MLDNCDSSFRAIPTAIKHRALLESTGCVRSILMPGSQRNLGSDNPLNLTGLGIYLNIFKNVSLKPIGHFSPAVMWPWGHHSAFRGSFLLLNELNQIMFYSCKRLPPPRRKNLKPLAVLSTEYQMRSIRIDGFFDSFVSLLCQVTANILL